MRTQTPKRVFYVRTAENKTYCDYLTPGKVYRATPSGPSGEGFGIVADHGAGLFCLLTGCAHLNGDNWRVTRKPKPDA